MKKLITIFIALILIFPTVTFAQEVSDVVIHVSPSGSDSNDGSINSPLASMDGARIRVRQLLKKQPITVLFHGGVYRTQSSVDFTLEDSGKELYPITYKAAEGEKVIFSGGTRLDTNKFTPVTDEKILARLPEGSRDKVGQLDLKEQGITKVDNIVLNGGDPSKFISLIVDDKDQPLSQWPNGEINYAQYEKVINIGSISSTNNAGTGGTFTYSEINPSRWTTAPDAFLSGYFGFDYRYEMIDLKKVDPVNKEITLSTGTAFGIINAESKRWKAFNLLEEIDIPGEWYIDRANLILYYYPPYSLKDSVMELTTFDDCFINADFVSNLRFEDFTFTQTQGNGIQLRNESNDIDVINCDFRYISKTGIDASGSVRGPNLDGSNDYIDNVSNCDISDNRFYYLGGTAITLNSGKRPILEAGNSHISNNQISHSSIYAINRSAITIGGVGNFVENNVIHNISFHAINFSGNDNKIRYNECYNVSREAYDAAVIYSGRTFVSRGNEIAYNFIHDYLRKDEKIGYDVVGVFLDDQYSGAIVHNNIFVNGAAGIQVGGGHHNYLDSNILVDIKDNVFNTDNRGETWLDNSIKNIFTIMADFLAKAVQNPYLIAKYPELAESLTNPPAPLGNTITNNLANKAMTYNDRMKELGTIDNNVAVSDLSDFVDAQHNDYRVKSDSDTAKKLPNIITDKNFDMSLIGIQANDNIKSIEAPNEETASFRKIYPQNGATDIDGSTCYLYWEVAPDADEYRVKIATDSNMENVVVDQISNFNYYTVSTLSSGYNSYYWTVEAINVSSRRAGTWKSTGVPYMFTTSKYDVLDRTLLKESIDKAQKVNDTLVEGANLGEYAIGTKSTLQDSITEANSFYNLRQGQTTQDSLDSQVKNLLSVMAESSKKLKTGYSGIGNMLTSIDDLTQTTAEMTIENGVLDYHSGAGTGQVYAKTFPNKSEIQCFKAKLDFKTETSWFGFIQRQVDTSSVIWSTQGYLVVVKPSQIEIQRFPGGIFETISNTSIPNDTWVDIEWGTIDVMNGVRIVFKVNGKTLYDQIDTSGYLANNGSFGFMSSGDCAISLKNADTLPTGDETYKYLTPRLVNASDYITDSSNWKATMGTVEVNNDTVSYKGENETTSMGYDVALKGDEIINMDAKFHYGDSWQALAIRASDISTVPWVQNDYLVVVKKDEIELQRFNKGKNEFLEIVDNNYIEDDKFVNIKLGAIETENGVRLLFYVNNSLLFDYIDTNALTDNGKLAFYDISNGGIEIKAPSLGDITVVDNNFNDEKGTVYLNTESIFSTTGTWQTSRMGYQGSSLKVGTPGATATWAIKFDPGIYKVYYWSGIDVEGDRNANLEIYASGEAQSRNVKLDMARDEAGWKYVGTSYPSDGLMILNLTGSGEGNVIAGAVKVVKSDLQELAFSNLFEICKNAVVLKLDSTKAFVDRKELVINNAPVTVNERTVVPIRFITEAFGAKVSWENATSTAIVEIDGHRLNFTENSKKYVIDNEEKELEQPAVIVNNTMMLPIRVISEDVGKMVLWDDSGLIVIADETGKLDDDIIKASLEKFDGKGDK